MHTDVEICILDLITRMGIFQCLSRNLIAFLSLFLSLREQRGIASIYVAGQREALHCWLQEIKCMQTRDTALFFFFFFLFSIYRRAFPSFQTRGSHLRYYMRECHAIATDTHCNTRVILQFNGLLKSVRYLPGDLPLNKQHTQEAHPVEEEEEGGGGGRGGGR